MTGLDRVQLGHALVVTGPAEAECGAACQLLEVGAGAEISPLAGEHRHLCIIVGFEGHERIVQGLHRRHRAGVSPAAGRLMMTVVAGPVAFDQNVIVRRFRILP